MSSLIFYASIEVRDKVEAVSMDMSRSYCQSILDCFPNAKPVVDRFHLAQNFCKCVDNARKHIQNHIRKHGNKSEVFKIRWALLKHVEDLKREEALLLILACNKYPVIEQLHYLKEGNNHKVKNIKRRGYGYRNDSNFNLMVKLEFECA